MSEVDFQSGPPRAPAYAALLLIVAAFLYYFAVTEFRERFETIDREAWLAGALFCSFIFREHLWRKAKELALPTRNFVLKLWFRFNHLSRRAYLFLLASFVFLIVAWMFAYETNPNGWTHRNRFTGAVCSFHESCWF